LYNEKVDIYAIGLILYEMCSLFKTRMQRIESLKLLKEKKQVSEIIKAQYPLEINLVIKMINDEPKERPSADEILNSEDFLNLKQIYNENK